MVRLQYGVKLFYVSTIFPANIRLGEDVLKTFWRRLQDVFSVTFFRLPRRLEDIIARRFANTSWRRLEDILQDVLKTSWRHFRKTYCKYVLKTSSRRLQEVLADEKCYAEDVFKTSWRRLGKQEMFGGFIPVSPWQYNCSYKILKRYVYCHINVKVSC